MCSSVQCRSDPSHQSDMWLQGGRVNTKAAKLLSTKPNKRAMPVSFQTCLLMMKYWQAELLEALVEIK